ncbi:MAG: pectin acetylesterase-family hydrolase [Meiothermus sp.]|nr:pectin acetylesterase-family hydrolase [Meiothermus sp.]
MHGVLRVGLLVLLVVGCASGPNSPAAPAPPSPAPTPQPSSSFVTVETENLVCSDGTPWRFFVSRGDPGKVLLSFQGGGACWNNGTCNGGTYTPGLNTFLELVRAEGIFDRNNTDNPFFGWTHVFVPYCTADIHWGNSVVAYGNRVVHHRGAVNARAALEWMFTHYPAPRQAVVTGCSAGAYGAALWSAYVMNRYNRSRVRLWADAGVGVVTSGFAGTGFRGWRAEQAIPDFIPDLAEARTDASRIRLPDLYRAIAQQFPSARLSQYTTQEDGVQSYFYGLMGGDPGDWPHLAQSSLGSIKQGRSNFSSYTAPGGGHCVSVTDSFYTTQAGGSRLSQWVKALVDGDQPTDVRP